MKKYQAAIVESTNSVLSTTNQFAAGSGNPLLDTVKTMKREGRQNAYILDVLRRTFYPMLAAEHRTPKNAEGLALAFMVEHWQEMINQPEADPDATRVLLSEPSLAERRPLVSKHHYIHLPDRILTSVSWAQKTKYRINKEMYDLCQQADLLEDWEEKDAQKIFNHNDGYFYLDIFLCFRGRTHTNHRGSFSPQSNKIVRACVDWGYEHPLDPVAQPDKYQALVDVLYDEYGVNHDNYLETWDNRQAILKSGKTGPAKVRAALCLKELNEKKKSAYIVQQDATQSGYQHAAACMRDEALGSLVNLLWKPGTTRADLYMEVVTVIKETDAAINAFLSAYDDRTIRSELAKDVVMLSGYGSSEDAIALSWLGYAGQLRYINEDGIEVFAERFSELEDCLKRGMEVDFNPDPIIRDWLKGRKGLNAMYAARDLALKFQKTLFDIAPSIKTLLTALKGAATSYYKKTGDTLTMQSPLGLRFSLPAYRVNKQTTVRISSGSGKTRKTCSVLQMIPDSTGGASGALPNAMHKLDATMQMYVNLLRMEASKSLPPEREWHYADIHDSQACSVDRVQEASAMYTEAFKLTHRSYSINKLLKDHNRPQLLMGNLDIEQIVKVNF